MLSYSKYITPPKKPSGLLRRKGWAFGFKVRALCLPYSSWNIPSTYAWKMQGTFPWGALSALKPGLIRLHNNPRRQREVWYSLKHKKVEVGFLKLRHSEQGDSGWESVGSGSAPTYTEPKDLNRLLETLTVFQHKSKSLKRGWQVPKTSGPVAELLVAQEVLKEWLYAYSKAKESHINIPKTCSYTRYAFIMCLLSSIWNKSYKLLI